MFEWWRKTFGPKPGPMAPCWVCDVSVAQDYPKGSYGSPLGGAFTLAGCDDCVARRAVTPMHAAWFSCLAGLDGRGKARGPRNRMVAQTDADGADRGRPVHVRVGRRYVTYPEWLAGQDSPVALAAMQAIRAAKPEAYLGCLLRI